LTKQEEKFCLLYTRYGQSGAQKAYLEAGYKDPLTFWPAKVKRMLSKEKIKKRLAEMESEVGAAMGMSKDRYLTMLIDDHKLALEAGDFKAAKDLMELIGRTQDYLIDKKVTMGAQITAKSDMTQEERLARVKALAALVGMKSD
jgi:hypothetical protein